MYVRGQTSVSRVFNTLGVEALLCEERAFLLHASEEGRKEYRKIGVFTQVGASARTQHLLSGVFIRKH